MKLPTWSVARQPIVMLVISLLFAVVFLDPRGLLGGAGEFGKFSEIQKVLNKTKSSKVLYLASYDDFYEIEPNFLRRFEINEDFAEAGYNEILTAASLGDLSFNKYLQRHGVTHIIVPEASSGRGIIFHKWATLGSISLSLSNPYFQMETASFGSFPVVLYKVLDLSSSISSAHRLERDLKYSIDWNSLWDTWFGVQRRVQEVGMYTYSYSYTYVDGPDVSWVFQDPVQSHQPANFFISTPDTTEQKFTISITFVAAYGGNAPPQTVRVSTPSITRVVSIRAGVPGKVDFIVHSNQRVVIDNVLPCRAAATFSPGDDNPLLFCYGISNFTVRAIP
jgi:hypothetical protein